jgi:hypothetical protein
MQLARTQNVGPVYTFYNDSAAAHIWAGNAFEIVAAGGTYEAYHLAQLAELFSFLGRPRCCCFKYR